ncbi:unnamed protein product [Rotaria sp. Silwood2]|nr:unnamed protein product [Rotaria sp. Silwood2]CAF4125426.1 unnamed protein product [Rotaria sp. Silwood2]
MSSTSKISEKYHFLLFVGMARFLVEVFYDEDCVSEKIFWKWLRNLNQEESNGCNAIIESTKDFFDWLLPAEAETTEEENDDDNDESE